MMFIKKTIKRVANEKKARILKIKIKGKKTMREYRIFH